MFKPSVAIAVIAVALVTPPTTGDQQENIVRTAQGLVQGTTRT